MNRRHRFLMAAGMLAPACAPSAPAAHRGQAPQTAVSTPAVDAAAAGPGEAEVVATSAPGPAPTDAPATTVTILAPPAAPATARRAPSTTVAVPAFVLPEAAGEGMSDVEWLVRQTFPETPDKAVRVARCESTLDPGAVNGEHVGVMQIATRVHAKRIAAMGYTVADLFGVRANLAVARAIYDESGWAPWTCAA